MGKHFLDNGAALRANELADARASVIQLRHWEAVLVGAVNKGCTDWLFFRLHVQNIAYDEQKEKAKIARESGEIGGKSRTDGTFSDVGVICRVGLVNDWRFQARKLPVCLCLCLLSSVSHFRFDFA